MKCFFCFLLELKDLKESRDLQDIRLGNIGLRECICLEDSFLINNINQL